MKFPIKVTWWHRGKFLEINVQTETLSLLGETGEKLATISWETLITHLQTSSEVIQPKTIRNYSRARVAVKLSYLTPDNRLIETLTGDIGGGGVFIENSAPLHIGIAIAIRLLLPDDLTVPLHVEAKVAWVRLEPVRNVFVPGMGVRFTDISGPARDRLVRIVSSLDKARYGK